MTNFLPVSLAQRLFFLLSSLFILSVQTVWANELAAPEFSHESGFYPEEFELVISHPDPEIKIYYTLDGSDPDPENLKGTTFRYKNEYAQPPSTEPTGEFLTQEYKTFVYDKPIKIKDRTYEPDRLSQISTTFDAKPNYFPKPERKVKSSWKNKIKSTLNRLINKANRILNKLARHVKKYILNQENVKIGVREYFGYFELEYEGGDKYLYKGTPVKAVAIDSRNTVSETVTNVLFIGDKNQFSLPVINIVLPEKYFFDYDEGILVAGKDYDNAISNSGSNANWLRKNKNLEANIVIINKDQISYSGDVTVRAHGGWSRRFRNKSLRIYPIKNKDKTGFNYDLFDDGEELGLSRFILRNSGNNYGNTYISDVSAQRVMTGLNFGAQRYQSFITFVNGEYYGVYNARDRLDKYYLEKMFKLPSQKVDLLKKNEILQHGRKDDWHSFIAFVENTAKNSSDFYTELQTKIDIGSFVDYFSSEIFIANTDWPQNNIRYWRYRGSKNYPVSSEGYSDGRWRWLMYDTDHAFGFSSFNKQGVKHNTLERAAPSDESTVNWSTFLLHSLLKNPEFEQYFITRFSDLLNSAFVPERTVAIVRDTEAGIELEMPRHIERWGAPKNIEYWRDSVNKIVMFIEERPKHQWQHLQDFFQLDDIYTVQFNIDQEGAGKIKLNTLTLGDDPNQKYDVTDTPLFFPWSGQYFKNMPLTIEALPENGYVFSHWEVSGHQLTPEQKTQSKLTLKPQDNLEIKAVMSEVVKL